MKITFEIWVTKIIWLNFIRVFSLSPYPCNYLHSWWSFILWKQRVHPGDLLICCQLFTVASLISWGMNNIREFEEKKTNIKDCVLKLFYQLRVWDSLVHQIMHLDPLKVYKQVIYRFIFIEFYFFQSPIRFLYNFNKYHFAVHFSKSLSCLNSCFKLKVKM